MILRKAVIFAIVINVSIVVSHAHISAYQRGETTGKADSSGTFDQSRRIENNAFKTGESLKFVIRYGPVHAGYAYMEIPEIVDYNNRRCYRIVSRAESNDFFSAFYRVRDTAISLIDSIGIFSWHFEKELHEGKYDADLELIFDQPGNRVITKKDTIQTPPYVQDVLSSFYYLRTRELEIGKSYNIDHFADTNLYPLEVKVLRKETIRVQAGKFSCIVVQPLLRSAGVFKHKGKVTVWLTNDRYRMPVLMKSEIVIGSIIAELQEHQGVYPSN